MVAGVFYDFDTLNEAQPLPVDFAKANVTLTSLADGGIVGIGEQFDQRIYGGLYSAAGKVDLEFGPLISAKPVAAELSNGNLVVVSQDDGQGRVLFTVVKANSSDTAIPGTYVEAEGASDADVAALKGGGFVMGYQRAVSAGNNDVAVSFFANDGTPGVSVSLDTSAADDTGVQVAQLEGGNVVIAWTRQVQGRSEIWYAIRTAQGDRVKGPTLFDGQDSLNADLSVTAMKGGGFALAYEDNQWGEGPGVTVATADALGSDARFFDVNQVSGLGDVDPDITTLSNGMLGLTVVSASGLQTFVRLIDPVTGAELAARDILREPDAGDNPRDPSIANIGLGRLAVAYSDGQAGFAGGQIVNILRYTSVAAFADGGTVTGDDFIDVIEGGGGVDRLSGGANNDRIFGDRGDDILNGDAGDDLFTASGGFDTIDGGSGNDTFDLSARDIGITATLTGSTRTIVTSDGFAYARVSNVENIIGGSADDVLTGDGLVNTLTGNQGADTLDGGTGADVLIGGEGDDIYVVDNSDDKVFEVFDRDGTGEATGGGADTVRTSVGYTLTAGQEIETLGTTNEAGTRAIDLTGNEFGQSLVGNNGANILNGGGGVDTMTGRGGADAYIVDKAGDRVVEKAGEGVDRVFSSVSYTLEAGQEIEALQLLASTGSAKLDLTGNAISQSLVGNNGANVLNGGVGRDAMTGRGGDDTYIVDNIGDRVAEAAGQGTDTVLASTSYALAAGREIEALQLLSSTGSARFNLSGNEIGQRLVGNNGANVLDGRGGTDLLIGRGGADSFVFSTSLGAGNVDRIADFAVEDTMRLSKSVFSALAPGQLAESAFKNISTGTADTGDRILYKQTTGELFYDADGSGSGAAVKFAVLDNKAALTAADFLVV